MLDSQGKNRTGKGKAGQQTKIPLLRRSDKSLGTVPLYLGLSEIYIKVVEEGALSLEEHS